MEKVKQLENSDIDLIAFDSEGFHLDIETEDIKHDCNGCYEITITSKERSDKTKQDEK